MRLGTQCFNKMRTSTTTKNNRNKKPEIPEYKNTIPDQKNSIVSKPDSRTEKKESGQLKSSSQRNKRLKKAYRNYGTQSKEQCLHYRNSRRRTERKGGRKYI